MLHNLSVVLVRPRFPENIGMAARAMANMGASSLVLVTPERWSDPVHIAKAEALATSQGVAVLENARVAESLGEALGSCTAAFGTTARLGGLRKETLGPDEAALAVRGLARQDMPVALVFGSEDRGLTNSEAELCTHLVHIPTQLDNSSLNLAQAVLLLLYECAKADRALPFDVRRSGAEREWTRPAKRADSRPATLEEEALLLETLTRTLTALDHIPEENSSWFMQPMRRFLRKGRLRRHEFDMLMGICRQIRHKLDERGEDASGGQR